MWLLIQLVSREVHYRQFVHPDSKQKDQRMLQLPIQT